MPFVGMMAHRQLDAPQVHAERAGVEAGVHEEPSHGMRSDWLAVDGGDEHALMVALSHSLLATGAEKMREARRCLRALRFFSGKEDENVGITATEPRDKLAVAQDYFGVGGTG